MRFLFDQSADFRLIPHLTGTGHDVTAVSREYRAGIDDQTVLAIAVREQRVLITADLDFGEMVVRQGLPHAGIVLLRLPGAPLETKIARLGRQALYQLRYPRGSASPGHGTGLNPRQEQDVVMVRTRSPSWMCIGL